MAIQDDFSITQNGSAYDIRHTSGNTVYSALDLHAWLQDLADDGAYTGDDQISILKPVPSALAGKRKGDIPMSLTLLNGFNIDETAARFINFGSIEQQGGQELLSGLKTIGGIVAGSPVYVVQGNAKLIKFWSNGHIQVIVKVKDSGALIDNGDVRVFSRKFGQTYSDFPVNLAAGGETSAALATSVDGNIALSAAQAAALSSKVTYAVADVSKDLGNGSGAKDYKGTITLSDGATLAEAYQYMMYVAREGSTSTIAGVEGWRYRALDDSYVPDSAAPFGKLAGGKFFLERGWWIEGVLPSEAKNYELIAADGSRQVPPNVVGIQLGGLTVGDRILVGRDNSGGFNSGEYTLQAVASGATSIVVDEVIKPDTPAVGTIVIGNDIVEYTAWSGSTFTVGATSKGFSAGVKAWVPFINKAAANSTESVTFIYDQDFTARVRVRNGDPASPIVPFETTFSVGSSGGSTNAIRNPDA